MWITPQTEARSSIMRSQLTPLALTLAAAATLLTCGEESSAPGPQGGGGLTATTSTTSTSSSSSTTDVGGNGAGGSGGAPSCDNFGAGEPNETPADALNLLVLSDNDPDPWPTLAGVIAGANDIDWYTYLGTDDVAAYVDPERAFVSGATDLRMCAYFWCTDPNAWGPPAIGSGGAGGGLPHDCPPGTEPATADLSAVPYGNTHLGTAHGCCTEPGTTGFHLGEDFWNTFWPFSCTGATIDDDMKVFIEIRAHHGTPGDICTPYVVEYHF